MFSPWLELPSHESHVQLLIGELKINNTGDDTTKLVMISDIHLTPIVSHEPLATGSLAVWITSSLSSLATTNFNSLAETRQPFHFSHWLYPPHFTQRSFHQVPELLNHRHCQDYFLPNRVSLALKWNEFSLTMSLHNDLMDKVGTLQWRHATYAKLQNSALLVEFQKKYIERPACWPTPTYGILQTTPCIWILGWWYWNE